MFAAHQFFPDHRAGTEVITQGLARSLAARGHETAVFAAKRSVPFSDLSPGDTENYTVEGVPIRRVGRPRESFSRPFRLNYENPAMAETLRTYIREYRPDVVHFMHFQGLTAAAIQAVKEAGIPAVYTATDFWAVCPVVDLRRHDGVMCTGPDPGHCPRCLASRRTGSRVASIVRHVPGPFWRAAAAASKLSARPLPLRQVRDLAERPAHIRTRINSLDRVLAPTRLTRDLLVENGVDASLIEVSHYGVDTSNVEGASRRENPGAGVRFGFVGTLAPHKGVDLLVRAFRQLPADSDATLQVHGGGEEFELFQAGLKKLVHDDPRITLAGPFPPSRVGEVLAGIDVLVVPSRWYENTPMVIYEAFAGGVPVVATDLGGISEVVEPGKNGLLFPLDDEESLTNSLRRLVEAPDLIGKLHSGIGPVKTVEESAEEMEKIYRGLLDKKSPAG